jgi:hypothetical protein
MEPQPGHVVLLGDSIFDNASYVGGGPDVTAQLRQVLPRGWRATLCAVDGATTAGLQPQLARVPADASHLIVSIGGNDALHNIDLLSLRAASSDEVLRVFAHRIGGFEGAYRTALGPVVAGGLPVTVCTIYNGALEAGTATVARVALALFNDVIIRFAIDGRLSAIELRAICTEPADYANPIEPSVRGGSKIAAAIARVVAGDRSADGPACIWGSPARAAP